MHSAEMDKGALKGFPKTIFPVIWKGCKVWEKTNKQTKHMQLIYFINLEIKKKKKWVNQSDFLTDLSFNGYRV